MASTLIATAVVEQLVQSGLPVDALEVIIDAADAEIVRAYGPHDATHVARFYNDTTMTLYLQHPASAVTEVKEWFSSDDEADVLALAATEYRVIANGRALERVGQYWRRNVQVTYTYADNARRAQVLVDLVRAELAYSGQSRERVGSYDVSAIPQQERARILARLRQAYGGGGLLA